MRAKHPVRSANCRRFEARVAALEAELDALKAVVAQLGQQLAAAPKNSLASSQPPSSDIVKPPKTPLPEGIERGGLVGPRLTTLIADLKGPGHAAYSTIRKFLRDVVRVTHARGGLVGPFLTTVIADLKGACPASFSTVGKFLRADVRGELARISAKVGRALERPYQQLRKKLPSQARLNVDETGPERNGERPWTWCFRAGLDTLFSIDPTRIADVLIAVLGAEQGRSVFAYLFRKGQNDLAANARKGHLSRPSVELLEGRALLANFISFGGHYYAATDGPLTWQQAENQAVKLGGHLASITSQAEQDFLTTNFAVHEDIWIGLSDQVKKGQYSWTTGEPVAYTAFFPGEPNGVGHAEDFEHMNLTSGLWDDVPGDFHYRGIIELNPTPKISSALLGDTLQVAGSMSGPPGQTFVIDFYAETTESGEVRSHLALTTVTTGADGSASFDLPLPVPNFPAPFVTATATDSSGNTSEFAKALLATRPIVTPPVVLPPVVEPPVIQPPIVTPPTVTPPLPVVQLPVTQPSMFQPPINTKKGFSIELSFATNATGGYVIEYDPTKSITGPGNSKNYLHVKVKFDVLSPKRPNAGQTLYVNLYWATDTDAIISLAAHLSMQFDRVSFTTGDTLDFYRSNSYRSFVATKPPEATRLVGVIDPGGTYKGFETNRENNTRSVAIGLQATPTPPHIQDITIDINNTSSNTDDITIFNAGHVAPPIQATVTNNTDSSRIIQLSIPNGKSMVSPSALFLRPREKVRVSIIPKAVSDVVNDVRVVAIERNKVVGEAHMTNVRVVLPQRIFAKDTPNGMPDRIPPRVPTHFPVEVTPNLGNSGQVVTLAVKNQNPLNGMVTINGNDTANVTATGDIVLSTDPANEPNGVSSLNQTTPGHAGKLLLEAQVHGVETLVQSRGFSVAAIPTNFSVAFVRGIHGIEEIDSRELIGMLVNNSWKSDSNQIADLNQVQLLEVIQRSGITGSFFITTLGELKVTMRFSPAQTGEILDFHARGLTGLRLYNSVANIDGTLTQLQSHQFRDMRTGGALVYAPKSGFQIVYETSKSRADITVTKTGMRITTPSGQLLTEAGFGRVSHSEHL